MTEHTTLNTNGLIIDVCDDLIGLVSVLHKTVFIIDQELIRTPNMPYEVDQFVSFFILGARIHEFYGVASCTICTN